MAVDDKLFWIVYGWSGQVGWLDNLAVFLDRAGIPLIVVVVTGYFIQKKIIPWSLMGMALLSRGVLKVLLNYLLPRPRPFVKFPAVVPQIPYEHLGPAFPSGHAAFLFAVAFGMYFVNQRFGVILILLAILLSTLRVYLGVHYPTDIFGGIIVAGISVGLVKWLMKIK